MENNPNINIEQENQIKGQNKEINFEEKKIYVHQEMIIK